MRKSEREELIIVTADLRVAADALAKNPIDRGLALGRILDSVGTIESMLADKKGADGD